MQKAHLRILAVELVLEPDTQAQGDVKQITFQRNDNFQRHCDMRTASSLRHILTSSRSNNSEAGGPLSQDPTAFSGSPGSRESSPFGIAELQEVRLRFGDTATELPSLTEEDVLNVDGGEEALLLDVSWGGAAAQGQRATMEDTHVGVGDLEAFLGQAYQESQIRSFFGIFDGHGGNSAAEFAKEHLLDLVVNNDCFLARPGEALNSAFLDLDEHFYAAVQERSLQVSGSTLLTALLCGSQLLVANAGDSRAVLCRRGRALNLSRDHKPVVPAELLRISTCGGYVCEGGFLNGQLGVSRGIGDYHLEPRVKQKPSATAPLQGPLTAEPEISMFTLMAEDEFIVLACDGLWDVLPSQRAVEIARQCLQLNNNDPQICAQLLVNESLRLHASDNVTVLVVCLSSNVPPKREFRNRAKVQRSFSQNGLDTIKSALLDVQDSGSKPCNL